MQQSRAWNIYLSWRRYDLHLRPILFGRRDSDRHNGYRRCESEFPESVRAVIVKRKLEPSLLDSVLRWLSVVPEVGDRKAWLLYLLLQLPAIGLVGLPLAFATVLSLPVGLGLIRPGRNLLWIGAVSYFGALLGAWVWSCHMWVVRRNALLRGAVPYAVVRVNDDGLLIRFRTSRVKLAWPDVISANSDELGFDLRWHPDGRLFGVHVSPSQSSILPSGSSPDDESMAEWITEVVAGRRADRDRR